MVLDMTMAVANADAARTRVRVSPRDPIPRTNDSLDNTKPPGCHITGIGHRTHPRPGVSGRTRRYFGAVNTSVPTNGTSASGTRTDPSAC
ncbi:hypothetical protein FMUAM8_01100 [Nocardia cyriacigeorgica]|nr:hypothetical protein FMUAM8_01100 [Nocardia cyriacigeorgica]BDU03845.1 hypothetical protein FMUBM48_01080 [Nocardia cyriacigeorgica]